MKKLEWAINSIVGNDFWRAYQYFYTEAARQHIKEQLPQNKPALGAPTNIADVDDAEYSMALSELTATDELVAQQLQREDRIGVQTETAVVASGYGAFSSDEVAANGFSVSQKTESQHLEPRARV